MKATVTVPVALLLDVKRHLEGHVGPRNKYDDEVSRLLDRIRVVIEENES